LSSSAIITRALTREGIPFALSTVRQLDDYVLDEIGRENYQAIIFLDLGSGSLSKIEKIFNDREVFVIDHHNLEDYKPKKIILLNPHVYGIDGGKEISCSGITYLFSKALNSINLDMAHIALLGAIGDMQEQNGFSSELNRFILDDAIYSDKVEVRIGLRMFGMQTRSINKVLEYTTDPFIPGVTGSDEGARRFIDELGINAKIDGKYKKLVQLSHDDLKKLVTGIILRRLGSEENPDDVLGKIYLLKDEKDESPMRDAKEFTTLLNACGRMNKSAFGIGSCLNDKLLKKEAIQLLSDYKREIINALNWFHSHRKEIIEGDGYVIINAGDQVKDTLIGTLASIISKSNIYGKNTILLSMAYTLDGQIKVSVRSVGEAKRDLKALISNVVEKVGGICGGHKYAAGALISQDKEEIFLKEVKEQFTDLIIET